MRLDLFTVENGLIKSRERAKEMIKSGNVTVNGKIVTKASADVSEADKVEITGGELPYVGRGGLKLETAINAFKIRLDGLVCMDIGASTGGFTDCMLKNNAAKVYAVDVGHGQLDEALRSDSRVVNMEKTNIKDVSADFFGDEIGFISADVSFISVTQIFPKISELLSGEYAAVLIKPQFEAGRSNIGKNGIVKDKKVHCSVIKQVSVSAAENGLSSMGIIPSPITGGDGNIEYLLYLRKVPSGEAAEQLSQEKIKEVTNIAFSAKKNT